MRRLHLTRRVCAGRERGARGAAVQEPRPRALERAAAQQQGHGASQSGSGRHVIASRPSRAAPPVAHPQLQAACPASQPFCSTAPAPSSQTPQTKPQLTYLVDLRTSDRDLAKNHLTFWMHKCQPHCHFEGNRAAAFIVTCPVPSSSSSSPPPPPQPSSLQSTQPLAQLRSSQLVPFVPRLVCRRQFFSAFRKYWKRSKHVAVCVQQKLFGHWLYTRRAMSPSIARTSS